MSIQIGILQFPGSNCDGDCKSALDLFEGVKSSFVWHTATDLSKYDGIVIPGGFSYGDYLRSGAMASYSPAVSSLKNFGERKPVFGICNGFQVLTESGLLPGALLRNSNQKFICKWVELQTTSGQSAIQKENLGNLKMPVAHGEGRYYIDQDGLNTLKKNNQILFKYSKDINGSTDLIAGITNVRGNIIGMMPHPERSAVKNIHGCDDGFKVWKTFISMCG